MQRKQRKEKSRKERKSLHKKYVDGKRNVEFTSRSRNFL